MEPIDLYIFCSVTKYPFAIFSYFSAFISTLGLLTHSLTHALKNLEKVDKLYSVQTLTGSMSPGLSSFFGNNLDHVYLKGYMK